MLPNAEIVQNIWSQSLGDYGYIATLARGDDLTYPVGKFDEYRVLQSMKAPERVFKDMTQSHGRDVFFTPLLFNGQRANHNVGSPGVLFADLDEAPDPPIAPTYMWNTSDNNRQAVWFLDEPVHDYEMWADVNRRLTYFVDADRGGWMGSKLLRIPGTVNWKRRQFAGPVESSPGLTYAISTLDSYLPRLDKRRMGPTEGRHPQTPSDYLWSQKIAELWPRMGMRGRSMLMKEQVRDRSLHIVRTVRELQARGLSPEDTFYLIWPRPWNKWRTDRHDPERLWAEIHRTRSG